MRVGGTGIRHGALKPDEPGPNTMLWTVKAYNLGEGGVLHSQAHLQHSPHLEQALFPP